MEVKEIVTKRIMIMTRRILRTMRKHPRTKFVPKDFFASGKLTTSGKAKIRRKR